MRSTLNHHNVFTDAIRNCKALPQSVRDHASCGLGVETSSFDHSYLEFLDQQIALNVRGAEWSQRLRERRAGLADWCDVSLIGGRFEIGPDDYTVKVDPSTSTVIYWEHDADIR